MALLIDFAAATRRVSDEEFAVWAQEVVRKFVEV